MLHLDSSHVAIQMLRQLLPEGVVAGGSFASLLPSPRTLSSEARRAEHERVRQLAMEQCVAEVAGAAGLPSGTTLPHSEAGRRWPSGFVGSATDKGTVVAAALAPTTVVTALGIDIERDTTGRTSLDAALIGEQSVPPDLDRALAILVAFSAKEAVFKAQFPVTRAQLSYHDINLSWVGDNSGQIHGSAICPGVEGTVTVRCATAAPWLSAVALIQARVA